MQTVERASFQNVLSRRRGYGWWGLQSQQQQLRLQIKERSLSFCAALTSAAVFVTVHFQNEETARERGSNSLICHAMKICMS